MITDPAGAKTEFDYGTSSGRIESVDRTLTVLNPDNSSGSKSNDWQIAYNPDGTVLSVADPVQAAAGVLTKFVYGGTYGAGTTTVTAPADTTAGTPALTTTYTLDPGAQGWLDQIRQQVSQGNPSTPISLATTYANYDGNGNAQTISRQIDATHFQTKTLTYDSFGNIVTETDPVTDSNTVTTTNEYDSNNNLLSTSVSNTSGSPQTLVTAYAYDSVGQRSCKIQNPTVQDLTAISCSISGDNLPASTTDSNVVTAYAYTTTNQLAEEIDPNGTATAYSYNPDGTIASTTLNYVQNGPVDDKTNLTTTYTYFPTGQVKTEKDPVTNLATPVATSTTSYTYDALGDLSTKTTPGDSWVPGGELVNSYDEFGSLTSTTSCTYAASPDACKSGVTSAAITTRDTLDRSLVVTDTTPAVGTTPATVTTSSTSYDLVGNVITSTATNGVKTVATYDALGRVLTATPYSPPPVGGGDSTVGATTSHFYDGLGDEIETDAPAPVTLSNPSGITVTTRTFYASGDQHTSTSADAGTVTNLYDGVGRQLGQIDSAGLTISSKSYDLLGRVLSSTVTNPATALDGTKTSTTTTIDTSYDPAGNVLTVTAPYQAGQPKLTNTNELDALGRVTSTTDSAGAVTKTYYDAGGNAVGIVAPDGSVTRQIYSLAGGVAETITNCSDDDKNPTSSPSTSACNGGSSGDWNVKDKSILATGSGSITVQTVNGTVEKDTTTDGEGRTLSVVVDPKGAAPLETDYAYDAKGRLIAQATPAPSGTGQIVDVITYDGLGRVSATITNCVDKTADNNWSDCTGTGTMDGSTNLKTTYGYDNAGSLATKTSPTGEITSYSYDQARHLTSSRIDNQPATFYFYDAGGHQIGSPWL